MKTLPLNHAEPGMRLASDIRDPHGAVLLAAGGELSQSLLSALRRRGISEVCVVEETSLSPEERAARREAVRVRLAHLFRHAGQAQADRLLFEAMLDYRMEQQE